ncbi:hypothetical protein [Kineosporia babensis]|uniref:Secreted protein n=1 Tax=Kineosporia babensis TaxID=499548 RepID=A0A9X1NKV1_9ACTN|nr:hypothetical protein [Kineosporia babensis]MCD5316867.1 hypothetical protein [Kineosporia babensis]
MSRIAGVGPGLIVAATCTLLLAGCSAASSPDASPQASASQLATGPATGESTGRSGGADTADVTPSGSESSETMSEQAERSTAKPSSAEPSQSARAEPEEQAENTADEKVDPAVEECFNRKGNKGEILVRMIVGEDGPPTVMRLGEGFTWLHGSKICVDTVEYAIRGDSNWPGYCTQVAKVRDNPGYDENEVPAPRLKRVIAQAGDCG